jgi:hypothetical protein
MAACRLAAMLAIMRDPKALVIPVVLTGPT